MSFKEKMQRAMSGRYGVDALGKFLMVISFILLIISVFLPKSYLYVFALIVILIYYYRVFSRNIEKRYRENCIYYKYVNRIKDFFKRRKSHMEQRKTHHIYSCPKCKQKIRIPKGKGKIAIRCSKCGTEFIRVSR